MATAESNTMETTTPRENQTKGRRSKRSAGKRFAIRRQAHPASRRVVTRLFWA